MRRIIVVAIVAALTILIVSGSVLAAPITWYVSLNGNNADGRSPTTAWSELANINWSLVQLGDTILVSPGMYQTSLVIGRDSVTIRANQHSN